MRITWAENPLETKVELDDADKLLLRERLKNEYLEDVLFSAAFALKNEHKQEVPLEDRVKRTLEVLDLDYVFDDVPRNHKTLTQRMDELVAEYTKDLLEKHAGDCTCFACSCSKCHAESMLGIDTIAGLGKHSAYKIDAVFANGATIDEAIQCLENYQPTYSPNTNWPKEEWEKHVPRWLEEGKRAHAWLVNYRDEHFARGER